MTGPILEVVGKSFHPQERRPCFFGMLRWFCQTPLPCFLRFTPGAWKKFQKIFCQMVVEKMVMICHGIESVKNKPRCSMYEIFTYIYHKCKPNVGTPQKSNELILKIAIFFPGPVIPAFPRPIILGPQKSRWFSTGRFPGFHPRSWVAASHDLR